MADAFTIKITGLKETQAILYKYSQKLGDAVVYKSLRAGAMIVLREARANAPLGKSGKLKRGIVIMKSKVNNGRFSDGLLGVNITIRKRKDDPFYGRFQEEGWNVRGKTTEGIGKKIDRYLIRRSFGSRTGRKTTRGHTDVPGKKFIDQAFISKREEAVRMIVATAQAGAGVLAQKMGL